LITLSIWLINHQPAILFSRNKPATSNQPAILFSQNKSAPAISHQLNEQLDYHSSKNVDWTQGEIFLKQKFRTPWRGFRTMLIDLITSTLFKQRAAYISQRLELTIFASVLLRSSFTMFIFLPIDRNKLFTTVCTRGSSSTHFFQLNLKSTRGRALYESWYVL
jgi:hypothetical protein